jgi:hypothetical protein
MSCNDLNTLYELSRSIYPEHLRASIKRFGDRVVSLDIVLERPRLVGVEGDWLQYSQAPDARWLTNWRSVAKGRWGHQG